MGCMRASGGAMSSAYPCKTCGMSPRNSIHHNRRQFGYHEWVEREEIMSKEDVFVQFAENIVEAWGRDVDTDEPIAGTDAVDYIVKLVADARDLLDGRDVIGAGIK